MRNLITAAIFFISNHALANGNALEIKCTQPPYTIEITSLKPAKVGSRLELVVSKDGVEVGTGPLELLFEGYDDSLTNSYIWAIESEERVSSIGVGVPNLKQVTPGKYEAFADFFVSAYGHDVTGSTVPCEVTIR